MTIAKIKKYKILVIVGCLFLATILLTIVLIVLGIDQKVIKTPLEVMVLSSSGEKIKDAEVSIQSHKGNTDSSGKYLFGDIDFGMYEITVTKNGFSPYKKMIKINRFSNNFAITLKSEEFGEIVLRLGTDSVIGDSIDIKINNVVFPVNKTENGFELKTGRLLTGNYLLEIISPNYMDTQTRIEISPGTTEKSLWLFPSADLVTEFEDYVNQEKIIPEKVSINIAGSVRQVNKGELVDNRLEIKDIDIAKDIKIEVKHKGYLKKDIKLDLKQGVNSLDKTMLTPEKRYLVVDGKTINSVQIDGTLPRMVYQGEESCFMNRNIENIYLAKCGDTVVAITTEKGDYRVLREYYWDFDQGGFLSEKNSLVTVGQNPSEIILIPSTSNYSVVYKHNKALLSVVGRSSESIYFSDEEAVYKLGPLTEQQSLNSSPEAPFPLVKEVIKGKYLLQDISQDKGLILAISRNSSTQDNLWIIDISKNQSKKLSFLPGSFSQVRFVKEDAIAYLDNGTLYTKQLDSYQQEEILKGVGTYWLDLSEGIFFAHKQGVSETVFTSRQNKLEKVLQIAK